VNVYVETNFCLELALQQQEEPEGEQILQRAEAGEFSLVFPAFSISEPFSTLNRYDNERQKTFREVERLLAELNRSAPHQPLVENLRPLVASLAGIGPQQAKRLGDVVGRMLACGRSIPLTAARFAQARLLEADFDLSPQDGIVAACVLDDLRPLNAPPDAHLFLSRNSNDFKLMTPDFAALGCKYLPNFRTGAQWLAAKA
jgi:hypothetical protein